jgi:hypothetical protein
MYPQGATRGSAGRVQNQFMTSLPRIFFASCFVLAVGSTPHPLTAQLRPAERAQFDTVEGTILSVRKDVIELDTPNGKQSVRIFKSKDHLPRGLTEPTSISVFGNEKITFLKPQMAIKFEAEIDALGTVNTPLAKIMVVDSDRNSAFAREPNPVAQNGGPKKAFRFFVRIAKINADAHELTVSYNDGSRKEQASFKVDPENTRVTFALSDLKYAKHGDQATIRLFPASTNEPIAVEVKVQRAGAVGVGDAALAANDLLGAAKEQPGDETPAVKNEVGVPGAVGQDMATSEPVPPFGAAANRMDEMVEGSDEQATGDDESAPNAQQSLHLAETEAAPERENNFPLPDNATPRRWYKIN